MNKPKIGAREAANDIRSGMTDAELMEKYQSDCQRTGEPISKTRRSQTSGTVVCKQAHCSGRG